MAAAQDELLLLTEMKENYQTPKKAQPSAAVPRSPTAVNESFLKEFETIQDQYEVVLGEKVSSNYKRRNILYFLG